MERQKFRDADVSATSGVNPSVRGRLSARARFAQRVTGSRTFYE